MNAEVLLTHFDRIGDAPDAVPRLRRFILDLAVRGKLVEQDPTDEPSSTLLNRLQAQKSRLVEQGVIRLQKPLPPITMRDEPFDIPKNWTWVRIGETSTLITKGSTPTSYGHAYQSSGINFIKVEAIRGGQLLPQNVTSFISPTTDTFLARSRLMAGDILLSIAGSIGTCAQVTKSVLPANTNQALAIIRGTEIVFDPEFVLFCIKSSVATVILNKARGGAMNNISLDDVRKFLVPVPPLSEQYRIVAKVAELMALCDRLERLQNEREERRDRLVSSCLHRLNEGDNVEVLHSHVRCYLTRLPRLTTRIEHIHALRQTVLDLAVRGRLVPQEPSEPPACEFLKRIQAEKSRLVAEGALRREKPLPSIAEDEPPFSIPTNWSWARIGTCSLLTEYGTSVKSDNIGNGVPVLAMGDVQGGQIILSGRKKVPAQIEDLPQLFLKRFDLLYNRTNSAELVGKTGIFMGEDDVFTFASYLIRIRFLCDLTSPVFVNTAMNAPYFRPTQIVPELRQQCGQANVNGSKLRNMLIPLPPFAEQQRIVAKVEELMTICDRLEAQLATAQSERSRLLEAILQETLNVNQTIDDRRRVSNG